jgi:hypothetical protein
VENLDNIIKETIDQLPFPTKEIISDKKQEEKY